MHKASPVELRTSIEMAHSLAQIGVRFVPIPVETDEEFHTLAASLSQKLEMMVAKAEADERDQVLQPRNAFFWQRASYSVCLCLPTWDLFNDTSAGKRPSQHCPSG